MKKRRAKRQRHWEHFWNEFLPGLVFVSNSGSQFLGKITFCNINTLGEWVGWDHSPGRIRIKHRKATKEFLPSFVRDDLPKWPFEEGTAFQTSEEQSSVHGAFSRLSAPFCSLGLMVSVTSI